MVATVSSFIKKQVLGLERLCYVKFTRFATAKQCMDWQWQPLLYTAPDNEKRFELQLMWKLGEPIGVLSVECGTFTPMDEPLIRLLHLIAPMVQRAVEAIEEMDLGTQHPLASLPDVISEFERTQLDIPRLLSNELSRCVQLNLTFYQSLVETYDYCKKVNDADTLCLLQAVS